CIKARNRGPDLGKKTPPKVGELSLCDGSIDAASLIRGKSSCIQRNLNNAFLSPPGGQFLCQLSVSIPKAICQAKLMDDVASQRS
ncbi:hypothetical protein JTE90_003162, partial [Oedothorax gibbosus]